MIDGQFYFLGGLCFSIFILGVIALIYYCCTRDYDELDGETPKLEFGDIFYTICKCDGFDVVVDKITKIMYLKDNMSGNMCAMLDKNGKPKKWQGVEDFINGRDKL